MAVRTVRLPGARGAGEGRIGSECHSGKAEVIWTPFLKCQGIRRAREIITASGNSAIQRSGQRRLVLKTEVGMIKWR